MSQGRGRAGRPAPGRRQRGKNDSRGKAVGGVLRPRRWTWWRGVPWLEVSGLRCSSRPCEASKGAERGRRSMRFRAVLPFRDKERGPSPCGLGPTEKALSLPPRSVHYQYSTLLPRCQAPVAAAAPGWSFPARLGAPPPSGRAGGGASWAAAGSAFASPPPAAAVSALPAG